MGSMRPARAIAPREICLLLAAALVQPLTLPSAHAAAPIRMGYIGISSDVTPSRSVDESLTQYAATVLGPTAL